MRRKATRNGTIDVCDRVGLFLALAQGDERRVENDMARRETRRHDTTHIHVTIRYVGSTK